MDPLEQLAETFMQAGKPLEALQLFDTALRQGETAELWNHWATIQFTCGDLTKAEAGYRRALDLNGCAREAAVNFGFMLFAQGRLQEAMPLLEQHKATLTAQEKKAISVLALHFQANQEQVVLPPGVATPSNKRDSNLGKWDGWYAELGPADVGAFRYSDTDTYQMAADFLSDLHSVEDWGCGAGGFKRFCKSPYIGLDGSKTPFADKIVDFCDYRSSVDGVMMRHVLEHNYEWEKVLTNAVASANRKMCLVLFTPFQTDGTREIAHNKQHGVDVPDLAFRREDIEGLLAGCDFTSRSLSTPTAYGVEHIYFITKRQAICIISANLGNVDACNMSRHVHQDLPPGWSVDHFHYDSANTKLRDKALHPRMQAKIYKMYAWQLHPGYNHYIWLDAAFVISSNHTARWMVESCGPRDIAMFRHSTRNSIKAEVEYCLSLMGDGNKYLTSRYGSEPLEEQVSHYYNESDPRDLSRFSDSLLIEAGAFCYRPTRAVKEMLQDWFLECCRWSCQDQISLPVVLQRHGVTPALFAANMYSNPYLAYVWRGWDG